jgi:20S proteasome alpha/beta subunit
VTVVVGFLGADGAVMASDSQASELDRTKYDAPKIWADNGLLFGYSGNTAVMDPVQLALEEKLAGQDTSQSRWTVKKLLCEAIRPVLVGEYANYVPDPPAGQIPASLGGMLLVIGKDANGYWLLDIDHNNVGTFHPHRGFHAIGSGSAAAGVVRGLLEHYDPEARTVWHLKLIAHRSVGTCIRVLDLGVGGEIQLWASTEEGDGFARVTDDDLRDVEHGISQWTVIERESLDNVMGAGAPEGTTEPAEAPPPQAAGELSDPSDTAAP